MPSSTANWNNSYAWTPRLTRKSSAIKVGRLSDHAGGRSNTFFHDQPARPASVVPGDLCGGGRKRRQAQKPLCLCDEYGTLPKIESAEMMFSASRRRLQLVPIIQSFSQLEKKLREGKGRKSSSIILSSLSAAASHPTAVPLRFCPGSGQPYRPDRLGQVEAGTILHSPSK